MLRYRMGSFGASLLALMLTPIGYAQEIQPATGAVQIDARSQPAVDVLRGLARSIGECPRTVESEIKWGKGPLEIKRWYLGPPLNVVWDVVSSRSARSPYLGFLEFTTSHDFWVPEDTYDKYRRQFSYLEGIELKASLVKFKFRYEYDIVPWKYPVFKSALSR